MIVKEALTCNSPMESQYYSAVLVKFELVCYYCGFGGDGSLVQDEEISQLCVCGFICFFFCEVMAKSPFARCHAM